MQMRGGASIRSITPVRPNRPFTRSQLMSVAKRIREAVKIVALGRVRPPQRFFLGQDGAQKEVTVWLDGAGAPRDVTLHHSLACADPLTICVAFKKKEGLKEEHRKHLTLKFRERRGSK